MVSKSESNSNITLGFNEKTWKKYQQVVVAKADELEGLNQDEQLKKRFD
jgi:hypothetical protein